MNKQQDPRPSSFRDKRITQFDNIQENVKQEKQIEQLPSNQNEIKHTNNQNEIKHTNNQNEIKHINYEKLNSNQDKIENDAQFEQIYKRKSQLEEKLIKKEQEINQQIQKESYQKTLYSQYDPQLDSYRYSEKPIQTMRSELSNQNESSQSGYDYQIVSQLYQKIERTEQSYQALKEMLDKTLHENKQLQLKLANTETNPEYPVHSNDQNIQFQTEINALRLNLNEKINDNLQLERKLDLLLDQRTSNGQIEDILKQQLQEKKRQQIEQDLKIQNMQNLQKTLLQEASKKILGQSNIQLEDAKDLVSKLKIDEPIKLKQKKQKIQDVYKDLERLEKEYIIFQKRIARYEIQINQYKLNEENLKNDNNFLIENLSDKILQLNDVRNKLTELHIQMSYEASNLSAEDRQRISEIQTNSLHQRKKNHEQNQKTDETQNILQTQRLYHYKGDFLKNILRYELELFIFQIRQKDIVIQSLNDIIQQRDSDLDAQSSQIGKLQADLLKLHKGVQPAKSKAQLEKEIQNLTSKNFTLENRYKQVLFNNKILLEKLSKLQIQIQQKDLSIQEIKISNKNFLSQNEQEQELLKIIKKKDDEMENQGILFRQEIETLMNKNNKILDELQLYKQGGSIITKQNDQAYKEQQSQNELNFLMQNLQDENQQLKFHLNNANHTIEVLKQQLMQLQNQKIQFESNMDEFMQTNENRVDLMKEDIKTYLAKIYELEIQIQNYEKEIQDHRLKSKTLVIDGPNNIKNWADWTMNQHRY